MTLFLVVSVRHMEIKDTFSVKYRMENLIFKFHWPVHIEVDGGMWIFLGTTYQRVRTWRSRSTNVLDSDTGVGKIIYSRNQRV